MTHEFYCRIDATLYGPFGAQDLKRMAENGKLKPTDMVRQGEQGKWVPAARVKGLYFDSPKKKEKKSTSKETHEPIISDYAFETSAFLQYAAGGLIGFIAGAVVVGGTAIAVGFVLVRLRLVPRLTITEPLLWGTIVGGLVGAIIGILVAAFQAPVRRARKELPVDLKDRKAIPELLKALESPSVHVRRLAIDALGNFHKSADESIGAVCQSLQDADVIVRRRAADILGEMGTTAKDSVKPLLSACWDKNDLVRQSAVKSLGRIGESDQEIIDTLWKVTNTDDYGSVRVNAAFAMWVLTHDSDRPIQALIKVLAHKSLGGFLKSPTARVEAAKALGRIGNAAKPAVQALKDVYLAECFGGNEDLRNSAASAMKSIDPKTAHELGIE